MQAAQYTLHGHGLVVLYKYHVQSGFLEVILVVSFYKIAALILKYGRLDHIKSLDITGCYFDLSHYSCSSLFISLRFYKRMHTMLNRRTSA